MENIKQQIEELKKDFTDRMYKLEQQVNKEQPDDFTIHMMTEQVNKPKIEVGKVYTPLNEYEGMAFVMVTGFDIHEDLINGYGISYKGEFTKEWNGFYNTERREATREEWETALTKYFDKLYSGVEKVDRSGLQFCKEWSKVINLNSKEVGYGTSHGPIAFGGLHWIGCLLGHLARNERWIWQSQIRTMSFVGEHGSSGQARRQKR